MAGKYIAPSYRGSDFTCPRCETHAAQYWMEVRNSEWQASRCLTCHQSCLWEMIGKNAAGGEQWALVYPVRSPAPLPNEDMPQEVKDDYDEAASVLPRSPRAAAALLRLAVQRLCTHLGQPGRNINDDIAALVEQGLRPMIQRAMDAVRITGNNAVHPGELDLNDNSELALQMFRLVNLVVEDMISVPKHVDTVWAQMPQGSVEAVAKRDGAPSTDT
jgi:hypothetical protein